MKKIIGIHQPQYFPWLGLIDRVSKCDLFVVLDTVPYSKNYFYNRNRIKTVNGPVWLTIPVLTKGKFGQLFNDTRIDGNQKWADKHWKTLQQSYQRAPFFNRYAEYLEVLFNKHWEFLIDICMDTFVFLLRACQIQTQVVRASELPTKGNKEELLFSICEATEATHYLSGPDGKNYLSPETWADKKIFIDFQDYHHPSYPQLFGNFISNMTCLDLLFNCGPESHQILKKGQPEYF